MRAEARESPDNPILDGAIDDRAFLSRTDVFLGQNVGLCQTQRHIVVAGEAFVLSIAVHIDIDLSRDNRSVIGDFTVQRQLGQMERRNPLVIEEAGGWGEW